MSVSRQPQRTWIVAAIPLLAMMLVGVLLFAVRSGENQAAPAGSTSPTASEPTASEPTATAPADSTPANSAPVDSVPAVLEPAAVQVAAEKIVAIVGDSVLTLDDLNEAATIDAIMAGLAGQPRTDASTLVEQLINTAVVLAQAGDLAAEQDVVAALERFLAQHTRSYDDLVVALATKDVTQARFDRYFARLVSTDAYLRRQQAATSVDAASLLRTWQQEARISFGPIANSILGAAQTPATAIPPAPAVVALAEPIAAPAEEPVIEEQTIDLPELDPDEPRGVEVGQIAPEFTLPEFTEGFNRETLRNFWGDPSVLIFWTTWCPYCLRQTPALVEAHRQWGDRGIQFVGINVKEDFGAVEPYVQEHGIEYPVLLDADGVTAAAYAVQGYPTTYFLDGDNRIVARHVGALTEEQLNSYLLMLRPAE